MNHADAFRIATELLTAFVQSQEIPGGGTSGTAESHGRKTAQFLTAMHRELYEYFRQIDPK